jgi:hypothetical protein
MTKPAFSKTLLMFVAALVLAFVPKPASARRDGGSHGGGSFHGGSSHGGGSFHAGGHSSFRGGRQSYRGSRGGARWSSTQMSGRRMSSGRMGGGWNARPGGFSNRSMGNFVRNSNFRGGSFGSFAASRNFGRSGAWQPAARGSRSTMGGWNSFGNSGGRSMPASARTWGNSMGGGWHSFGNLGRGGGAEMPRGYRSDAGAAGQWHSFGNSRNGNFASNGSGWSSFGRSRATASYAREPRREFGSNRFSRNLPSGSRFSSFSSFSSGRSMSNFGGSRFSNSGFGGFDFGNSDFGRSGFSSSFFGSDLSLIPNLLFGGFFRGGPSIFGGPAFLGANVLALAASSIVSELVSNGTDQGGFAGGNEGFGAGGFGPGLGFEAAPVWPACGPVISFGRPGWAWSRYCGPYSAYPLGWSGSGYFGGGRNGYNATRDAPGDSEFN